MLTYQPHTIAVVAVVVVRVHVPIVEVQVVRVVVPVRRRRPVVAVVADVVHIRTVAVARSRK